MLCVCVHVCMHVLCMCVHVCVHVLCMCVHVCMCVCFMYTCICILCTHVYMRFMYVCTSINVCVMRPERDTGSTRLDWLTYIKRKYIYMSSYYVMPVLRMLALHHSLSS